MHAAMMRVVGAVTEITEQRHEEAVTDNKKRSFASGRYHSALVVECAARWPPNLR